jgi:hypothetical protein
MTSATPRFSVLLPTHNRADVLGFAIGSVLAQTERDSELLIVADGCTDGTRDVVSRFHDPRLRFFDLPKAPHFGYANRNVALREARGRLIAFAAHDDLLFPDHLALMGALVEGEGASWGYSRPLWVSTDGVVVPFATDLRLAVEMRQFQLTNTIPAACVVHTREALQQAGFWPEDVSSAGDWVLWRRILAMGTRPAAYLRAPTTFHFSADWKKSRFSASPEVARLVGMADEADWWPAILRHPPILEPEQATLWRAMRAGGESWVADVRAAVEGVLDRIAWIAVQDLLPGLDAARAEALAAGAREEKAQAEARAQALAAGAREQEAWAAMLATAQRESQAQARAEAAGKAEAEARDELDAVKAAAQERVEEGRRAVEALRASTSWRLTAPLRGLVRMTRLRPRGRR